MINIGNFKEFGNQILDFLIEGYLVLSVYKEEDKIYCVESYGYDSSKNDNIYFGNYEPCKYSMISENGDCFVDTKFESFDFIPVYSFKELMIRDARMIQKQEGEKLCEIYRTKSNKRSAEAAWGLGGVFCDEWANEFGWA